MTRTARTLAASGLLLCSCASATALPRTPTSQQLATANEEVSGKDVELRFTDSSEATAAREVSVDPASVAWTDPAGKRQSVPPDALSSVRYVSRGRGALEGAGFGLLAGALAGSLIGVASGNDPPCGAQQFYCVRFNSGEKALGGAIVLGLAGAALGAITGALVGHQGEVKFTSSP